MEKVIDVLTPGVVHVPKWSGHGAMFVYSWKANKWIQVNYHNKHIGWKGLRLSKQLGTVKARTLKKHFGTYFTY